METEELDELQGERVSEQKDPVAQEGSLTTNGLSGECIGQINIVMIIDERSAEMSSR